MGGAVWIAVLVLNCTGSGGERHGGAASADDVPVPPGAVDPLPLPDLALPDLRGDPQRLRASSDEVTVINFWATWCVPCLREIPALVALAQEHGGEGVRVIGIAVDSGEPEDIDAFASRHGMEYTVLRATYPWAHGNFGVFGLPVTLIVDRAGLVRHRLFGPHTLGQFEAAIRPYL